MPFGLTLEFSFVYYIFFTDLGLILFIILKNILDKDVHIGRDD